MMTQNSILFYRFRILILIAFFSTLVSVDSYSQTSAYPDQHFLITGADSLLSDAETVLNIEQTDDGKSIRLSDNVTSGYLFLEPQKSEHPFNIGLASWNGLVEDDQSAFRVFVRVPYGDDWSPWLEVGFWKANIWGSKQTSFGGGYVDIDILTLKYFVTEWQFAVEMKRLSTSDPSPALHLLSFFMSDSRTTDRLDYTEILNDNPPEIFIETDFVAQRKVDPQIGGSICSPSTVSMILLSYGIDVDPYQFALDTKDPYYGIFGVWPRVVQNASEFGLRGMVTRYRTWSDAYHVLAQGGRIGMSIGPPLYGGHLVMLAGFTENGDPIVHDPAKTYNGYGYVFDKSQLSQSWFNKGGVGYTFYPNDTTDFTDIRIAGNDDPQIPAQVTLHPNYPNPFNASTTFFYELKDAGFVDFSIYNMLGEKIVTLENSHQPAGQYLLKWNGT
ncbi:hypothetical protein GF337_12310, partial [candidate division KSB1 bacterium]|nr:hypothetical protein [candidate division KSB1 bacterium]